MANPLKVLTQLSASKEAQFAEVVEMQKTVTVSGAEAHLRVTGGGEISGSGAFKAAGAAELGSTLAVAGNANLAAALDVKGAAALSSSLGVVGAADLQSSLTLAGAADFNSTLDVLDDAIFRADVDVNGYMKAVGEISGSAALNIGGAAHIVGNSQLDGTLDVEGAADLASTLLVAGNITAQASASIAGDLDVDGAADIAGDAAVHGNATIYGNLEVKGTMTTIESTTVTVADANIQLATVASPTDATADGAGITVLGATNKTFQWNNDGHGFTSSEDMNLAAGKVYKIDGQEVLAKDASQAKLSFAGGTANVRVQDNWVKIAGPLNLEGAVEAEATMLVTGVATFSSDITASAGLDLAGKAHIAGQLEVDNLATFHGALVKMDGQLEVDMYADFNSGVTIDGNTQLSGTLKVDGIATFASDVTASAGLDVAGAAHIVGAVDMDSTLNVDGQADFQAAANFHADVAMDAALNLSGSAFINITTPVVSGKYNVNDAIRALDAKAGQQASDINTAYANLRYLASANFDAQGMKTFVSQFAFADIEKVTVDVLVKADGSSVWTNDLVSIQVKAGGAANAFVAFEISAPAMGAADSVRIIAVKEQGNLA
jgi:cytoskeletal protein CcmA (bactofilin family)